MTDRAHLVFHHSAGVGSDLIRLRTRGWSNHVSILYTAPAGTYLDKLLYEARSTFGVTGPGHKKARTLDEAIAGGDMVEVYQLPFVPAGDETAARLWLDQQLGKGYDKPGILGFIPLPLSQAISHQLKRQSDELWFCSELGQGLTVKRGKPALVNVQPWQVDPEWLRSSPLKTFVFATTPNGQPA